MWNRLAIALRAVGAQFLREHKTNGHARLVACDCMIAPLETEHIFIWQKLLLQKK